MTNDQYDHAFRAILNNRNQDLKQGAFTYSYLFDNWMEKMTHIAFNEITSRSYVIKTERAERAVPMTDIITFQHLVATKGLT